MMKKQGRTVLEMRQEELAWRGHISRLGREKGERKEVKVR